jgi:hypothetical protein
MWLGIWFAAAAMPKSWAEASKEWNDESNKKKLDNTISEGPWGCVALAALVCPLLSCGPPQRSG